MRAGYPFRVRRGRQPSQPNPAHLLNAAISKAASGIFIYLESALWRFSSPSAHVELTELCLWLIAGFSRSLIIPNPGYPTKK